MKSKILKLRMDPHFVYNLFIFILVIGFVFCIRGVAAQEMSGAPILITDGVNINAQAPAKEFFLYPMNESVNDKALFPVARFFQTEFTIQNTGPSYKCGNWGRVHIFN